MINFTPDYEYKQVNTRDLFVDNLYQRELNGTKVNHIVKTFNPYLINAIKVSYRDGKYWIFDGQHTKAAIVAKNEGKDKLVDCKVFYGLTRLDEMELFIAQNGASSAVQTREKFRAMYNLGDPEIKQMVRLSEYAELIVDFKASQADNRILAVSQLYKTFKLLNEEEFVDMLRIIKEAWQGSKDSLTAEIIGGMTKFYIAYRGEFSRKRLISRLAKVSPIAITRDGKVTATSGNKRYAKIILGIYNQNTSTNRLEEKL